VGASWGSPQVCKGKRLRRTPGDAEGHHGCKSPAECSMQVAGSSGVGFGFDFWCVPVCSSRRQRSAAQRSSAQCRCRQASSGGWAWHCARSQDAAQQPQQTINPAAPSDIPVTGFVASKRAKRAGSGRVNHGSAVALAQHSNRVALGLAVQRPPMRHLHRILAPVHPTTMVGMTGRGRGRRPRALPSCGAAVICPGALYAF
jgi:hypothetical protein